jgi:hypothetical protein
VTVRRVVGVIAVVCVAASCVPTTRDERTFQAKATVTAEKMLSAVRSAELLALLAERDRLLPPYAATAAAGTEEEATAVQGTFDAIQPPDAHSDRLRDALDGLLTTAVSAVSTLRIAARRADFAAMAGTHRGLHVIGSKLEAFAKAHQ